MSAVTEHLVRRAVTEFHTHIKQNPDNHAHVVYVKSKGNVLGLLLVCMTILLFSLAIFAVQYTYGELIAALAAVEAPTTTAIIRTAPEDNDEAEVEADKPLLGDKDNKAATVDQEVLLIKQRPLTSRLCSIRRHLRARGGRLARFRGLHIHILESFVLNITVALFSTRGPFKHNLILRGALEVLVTTALTNCSLWWNHYIISEPASKPWYQSMPTSLQVRKALAPTAINAAIQRFSSLAFVYIAFKLGALSPTFHISTTTNNTIVAPRGTPAPAPPATHSISACIVLILTACFVIFAIQIPSTIAITRVRASLLADDTTPIIPFDKSFNGQALPTSAGGRGMLGMWQAWAGADRSTRLRVLGVYFKTFAMQISLMLLATAAVFAELRFILGPEYLQQLRAAGFRMF